MLKPIEIDNFNLDVIDIWKNRWFALLSGNEKDYNSMTVAWGSIGFMWKKPFVQIVVRPTRYTYELTEKYETFSLNAFSNGLKPALTLFGSKTGRDTDKIKESGLTLQHSDVIDTPYFQEAELVIECKKIYFDDFKPEHFLDSNINKLYPQKDYHRIYFGEIINILKV